MHFYFLWSGDSVVLSHQTRTFTRDLLPHLEARIGRAHGADFALGVFYFVGGFRMAGRLLHSAAGKESSPKADQRARRTAHRADHHSSERTETFASGGIRDFAHDLIGHAKGEINKHNVKLSGIERGMTSSLFRLRCSRHFMKHANLLILINQQITKQRCHKDSV